MNSKILTLALFPFVVGCVETTAPPPQQKKPAPTTAPAKPQVTKLRSASSGLAAYKRVSRRVEPVAERSCREMHPKAPQKFCDFQLKVLNNPKQPPNAFQSIGKDGRPVITFNINMLRSIQNDHEVAFIMGHEAGHQMATHLIKQRQNATAGALIGGILAGALGASVNTGTDLGGFVGARSYSKNFELQADRIGAYIADRAGYNPVIGARSFNRTRGSSAFLATHPPSQDRINTVNQTAAKIKAEKARGVRTPPIRF
ncbi:M48 family metalloprotease [Amylibacter sp. SFDW26]|uniref:M48 family metalloprotease n=1 Tax=Amylibacter sp. SFDW26 TaxID=2652722 RepID=UPI001261CF15|nr:M48 family metalloprotease [Amylibacter sp. SFDW26]KAB7613804.1 M48 family metalloprotease [Amylibacter sp. SFDW26]